MYFYLSFDPGLRTGVVGWTHKGIPLLIAVYKQEELDTFLYTLDTQYLKEVILEEYRVNNNKFNHQGSKVYTIQVIGQIKAWARINKIPVVEQRTQAKDIAAMWSQTVVPKGHMPDKMSAYLHGYYRLHMLGIIKAKVLEEG